MFSARIEPSTGLEEAAERFLDELGDWALECVRRYGDTAPTDGHDQGTYTTGWAPWVRRRDDGAVLAFLKDTRDRIRDHFVQSGAWQHGYWRVHEPHHGTEHYELFLGTLLALNPNDDETARQLDDAAEHVGNWVAGVPDWYDADARLFRAVHMGTAEVADEPPLNVPDHVRFVNVCLLAHRATARSRYIEFCTDYLGRWAEAVNESESLPVALGPDGGVTTLGADQEQLYRSFVGMLPQQMDSPVDRAENLLASDVTGALLQLGSITGERHFRRAAERIIDVLVTQLPDPDAGAAADAVRAYRNATGERRYDEAVMEVVESLDPWSFSELTLDPSVRLDGRPSGIGKRADMLRWLEDGRERRCNPLTLALGAEIRGDRELAARALDIGRVCLSLARRALPDGRDHGCAAKSVSAVCRGHGRQNHAGVTTAALEPLLCAFEAEA